MRKVLATLSLLLTLQTVCHKWFLTPRHTYTSQHSSDFSTTTTIILNNLFLFQLEFLQQCCIFLFLLATNVRNWANLRVDVAHILLFSFLHFIALLVVEFWKCCWLCCSHQRLLQLMVFFKCLAYAVAMSAAATKINMIACHKKSVICCYGTYIFR